MKNWNFKKGFGSSGQKIDHLIAASVMLPLH